MAGETDTRLKVKFLREPLTPSLLEEMRPMNEAHYKEIAHYKDIPLKIDRQRYLALEAAGILRCYTVRDQDDHRLVGYAVFIVQFNMHYSDSLQAAQDVIFLAPEYRGQFLGSRFINWCDDRLRDEGAQAVYQHVKVAHDFGKLLERLGYEPVDIIYARRLDKEKVK